jgi:hypothetical protein
MTKSQEDDEALALPVHVLPAHAPFFQSLEYGRMPLGNKRRPPSANG